VSPSVFITTRKRASGNRYVVRYRRGGRYTPVVHAGSFKTMREARLRKDFVAGELAAGRDPAIALRALTQPTETTTFTEWFDRFSESRVDVSDKTKALYRNARDKLGDLAEHNPASVRPSDLQTWVGRNRKLSPRTIRQYVSVMRQVLDFADVEPNPANSPKLKVPALAAEEVSPPGTLEWEAIRERLPNVVLLAARLIECDALRISEARLLTFGDVDFAEGRIRISRARTKGGTAGQRWLPVPDKLMDEIDALVPLEDRHATRPVFNFTESQLRGAIERACKVAGIAHYHPHDLRHRRISLWVAHGFDPVAVKTWAGHSRASMSLDVYSHVVIDRTSDEWREFWIDVYTREREARVRSGDPKRGGNPHG
jgi:integrase